MIIKEKNKDKEVVKLPPELKVLWVEALRSGSYKQTTGSLRDTKGFCCLGVLLDVINPLLWEEKPDKTYTWDNEGAILPQYVRIELNLSNCAVMVKYDSGIGPNSALTGLNDGMGLKFKQIADIIEEQL